VKHYAWPVLLASCFLAGAWAALRLRRAYEKRKKRARARRALGAERRAVEVLTGAGYRWEGSQVRASLQVVEDGCPIAFDVIADHVVSRWGRRWVAEVKTGERALDLRHAPTRRQLLEYRLGFDVAGVLLVDAERGRVRRVEMPFAARGPARRGWLGCAGALLLGIALGVGLGPSALEHLWSLVRGEARGGPGR
jgi:hypothetical protein